MLGSLGRILRQVGCDTVIMRGTFVDHDECIRASMKDDRVILTASKQLTMQRVSRLIFLVCEQVFDAKTILLLFSSLCST